MGKGAGSGCRTPMLLDAADRGAAPEFDAVGDAIRASLTDDLLKPEYRGAVRPFTGHCYVASEAYFHLMGGKEAGWKPVGAEHEGSPHWWLEHADGRRVDLTAEQFETPVPYQFGKGRGFLTRQPSKRAQVVIDRVRAQLTDAQINAARR